MIEPETRILYAAFFFVCFKVLIKVYMFFFAVSPRSKT